MNCPDCGNKMKFDGTGYSIQEQEYHDGGDDTVSLKISSF